MRLIVDANGLLYRSAFGLDLTTISGRRVGGAFGFMRGLEQLLQATEADELTVCWDGGHERRSAIYPEYKANRQREPDVVAMITDQRSLVVHLLSLLPVIQVWEPDVEADDAIAIISKFTHLEEAGIVTGDHDLYQLATDRHSIFDFKGKPVKLEWRPSRYLATKVLVGDPSDNIKGVDQIGPVKAGRLLDEHRTLKDVLRATKSSGKLGAMVWSDAVEVVKRNLKLMKVAHLVTKLERSSILNQYKHGRRHLKLDERRLQKRFMELEFNSLVRRLSGFLASFRPLEKKSRGEADAKAEQYRERVCQAFAESRSDKEDTESETTVRRVRQVDGRGTASGRSVVAGRERREATPTTKRLRKTEVVGAHPQRERRGNPRAVRAGDGTRTDGTAGRPMEEGRRRAGRALARVLGSPEVLAKRKLRRDESLSILSSLQTEEGWEWLKQQPTEVLRLVSIMIEAVSEDQEFAPSKKALGELKHVHEDFCMEEPDWMKVGGGE